MRNGASKGSRSGGGILPRTTPAPLARHDGAVDDQLAAPDSPGLSSLERPRKALLPYWALSAERLGQLDLLRPLGEPELRVVLATGDCPLASRRNRARWGVVSDGPCVEVMGPILKK